MNSEIKLLIFDLDGTIADTINSIMEAVNMTLCEYSLPKRSYEQIRMAIGNGARELIRRSVPSSHEPLTDELLLKYNANYELTYGNLSCYEGMAEAMRTLKSRGYTLAVLSNKPDRFVKKIVEILFPDGLISVSMGQTAELPRKPDPTVPLMIASGLGYSAAETAFVGDSEVDILTGRNSGMMTIGCAWGYRGAEALEEAMADRIIYKAKELEEIFL